MLNTFQDNLMPAPSPGRISGGEAQSTEIDVDEDSQSALDSTNAPQLEIPQPSNTEKSREQNIILQGSMDRISQPRKQAKRSSRGMLQIVVIVGVGLLVLFLCGSLGLFGTWAGLQLPGFFQRQDPTEPPADTAVPTPIGTMSQTASSTSTAQEVVLFTDDFSDPLSGWPTIQNAQGEYSYQKDGYHIKVDDPSAVLFAKTNRQDEDISVDVNAKPVIAGTNGYYGLLCRMQDAQNFYYFVIQNDGAYMIGKYKNAEFQFLFSEGWRHSDAINQGSQTNRLKADCMGNTLRFYVNNVILGEVNDTDFNSGFSGILVAPLDVQSFEVLFNNFRITKPGS
jgi:hypothetical protein